MNEFLVVFQAALAAILAAWAMSLMLLFLDAEKQDLRRKIALGSFAILFAAFLIISL